MTAGTPPRKQAHDAGCWLPAHQEHVLFTVAHVDATIDRLALTLESYLAEDPLILRRAFTATAEEAVYGGAAPLPQAVRRLFADALNQLRNVLEHVLHAEVEKRLERPLSEDESKSLQVPAAETEQAFEAWLRHKHRHSLGLLTTGDDLYERLLRIQPFQRRDAAAHPLKVLVEHTNFAKHREPTIAFTRIGRVDRDSENRRRTLSRRDKIEVGDVLLSVPIATRETFSIWPEVAVQRPHTGQWETLVKEVRWLEEWVRLQSLPILLAGQTEMPPIPPDLDIRVGYQDAAEAWRSAGTESAAERMQKRMVAEGLRRDVLEMLVDQYGEVSRSRFSAWLSSLDAPAVMQQFDPVLKAAARGDSDAWSRSSEAWGRDAGVDAPQEKHSD